MSLGNLYVLMAYKVRKDTYFS